MAHKIGHLSFGSKLEAMAIRSNFGETMKNELSGTEVKNNPIQMGQMYAEYVIDITELEFEDKHNPPRKVPV